MAAAIKTCMQGDVTRENYGTLTQTASVLYKEQGIGRFFNGWSALPPLITRHCTPPHPLSEKQHGPWPTNGSPVPLAGHGGRVG